jgi:hypothetical protein
MFNLKKKEEVMDNHTNQMQQYAKLETLYSAIIYLQKEVKKAQYKLEQLKQHESKKDE